MATASDEAERDSGTELAEAVHQVFAILTDLRSDVRTPELKERIAFVQWLRQELGDVETLLVGASARQDPAPTPSAVAR